MLQYLNELSIEEIHEFRSSQEFERTYFLSLIKKTEAPSQPQNQLNELHPDVVKFLNGVNFASNKAIEEDQVELVLSADKMQILKASVAKVFDKVVTEIVAKNTTFETFVPSECHEILKALINDIKGGKADVRRDIPIRNEKKEYWVVEISGRGEKNQFILKLADRTKPTAIRLGKAAEDKADDRKPEPKKPIDLIFFRPSGLAQPDFKKWVTKAAALLKMANLWPAESRPKFVAIRYEEEAHEKAEYNHPFIDDLLCLPFDRLIFLQKTELALGLPKKVSPSFLFVQEADDEIEISKRGKLSRICDLGFAIENPLPLAQGTPGHFYFRFPGQKPLLDVNAKAQQSVPHPDLPELYWVYFNFFAFDRSLNKEFRQYLARDSAYRNVIESDPNQFQYNPDNIFFTDEQKARKTVAVLDPESSSLKSLVENIKTEIHNVDVVGEDSYYNFFRKYIERKNDDGKAQPATVEDFYAEMVSILVGTFDLNLQMPLTPPNDEDRFFGFEIKKLFSDAQGWLTLFDGDARNLLMECFQLVVVAKRLQKSFEIKNASGELRAVSVEFIAEDNGQNIRINFTVPETRKATRSGQIQRIETLDAIVIDYALLPQDLDAFFSALRTATENSHIKIAADGPKVIVTSSENQKLPIHKLIQSKLFGLIYKPVEVRRLLYLVSEATTTPFTVYNFENIGWKDDTIPVKIAKSATMVELSEFGATIRTEQALKPGTMLYLFKSIFINAPDQNLCARVYFSEEDSSNEGFYLVHVVYFGITDAFLKFTRAYIRETYAQKKSKEGTG